MEILEYCLDTDVVIEFLKDKKSVASIFIRKAMGKVKLHVTSITVYELFYGPKYSGYEKEIEDISSLLMWVNVLPLDLESAKIAAEIDATLHKKGKPIGLRDVFIAAISVRNSVSIVTRNIKHFQTISMETKYKIEALTPETALQEIT